TEEARKRANASEEAMRQAAGEKAGDKNQQNKADPTAKRDSSAKGQAGQNQQQNGDKQGAQAQKQSGQNGQQGDKQQAGQKGQQGGQQSQQGEKGGDVEQKARDAAEQMDKASDAMKQARESQVNEWKSELTNALDQAIQEMLQMARQEHQLEQKARSGQSKPEELRGE